MLLKPRRLPSRYNRRVQVSTRKFVQRRQQRRRQYLRERAKRLIHRFQRQLAGLSSLIRRFLLLFVAGLTLLIMGLMLFSPLFDVREIRVLRTDPRIDVEQVQRALVPIFRRHLFFLSASEVEPLLTGGMPDLTDVSVEKRYPSTLVLHLTLDPVIARLAIESPDAKSAAPVTGTGAGPETHTVTLGDYLTARGRYVTYLPSQVKLPPPPLIRIVDWGVRPSPWTTLIEPELLLLMREAEKALKEQFGQEVSERTVYVRAQEFHLRTKAYALWFDRRSSLEEHLQRYRIFLRTIGMPAAKQYVDLRLTDRIVYK